MTSYLSNSDTDESTQCSNRPCFRLDPKFGSSLRSLVRSLVVWSEQCVLGRVQVWAAKQAVAGGTLGAQRFAEAPRLPPGDGDDNGEDDTEADQVRIRPVIGSGV